MELVMFSLLRRKKAANPAVPSHTNFLQPASGVELLNTPRRQKLLENIWQRASLSRLQFAKLYRHPLERFAELVQQLPASENHHHAHLGGMLDHGLEIVAYALKIRQTYLLPIGAPPESQSAQAEAWTAAAAYGALIHDLGKIAVDMYIETAAGETWHPWHGPLSHPYRFKYVKDRNYQLHGAAASLIYAQVLTPEILDWLCGFPELWAQLIFTLAGQYEHAGILGEIVIKADQASVAQALGGNPERAVSAPRQSLQRQLADGLRHLVRDKFKLNQADGPSDGWLSDDALWLVSKPTADQLRAYLLAQGIEGIPSSNAPFFNLLQDQGVIQRNAQDKAIWKVTVDNDRGWRNTFTLLKLSPALIWNDPKDRPQSYFGTLEVEAGNPSVEPSEEKLKQVRAQPQHKTAGIAEAEPIDQHPTHLGPASPNEHEDLEDLLTLFNRVPSSLSTENNSTSMTDTLPPEPTTVDTDVKSESSANTEVMKPMTSNSTDLGLKFVDWLKTGIASRHLIINDVRALVHTVDGTAMLVTPGIFKRYAQEFPDVEQQAKPLRLEGWELVQRSFEKQKLHRKTAKKLNIWDCNVIGPRRTNQLKGYLLQDPHVLFTEVPFDNVSLSLDTKEVAE
ncbi:relaxase [Pseudomonas gessardii]|uniref:DNA-binding domain-containing protein n=2 Tax=Pseudomonas gessardii TaxID=78544 RepID=A0A7Y1MP67_9PSED|nr:relaxase [Pseudomonas gessardii]NNA95825.1 DNA-binding domain-containing protein [Pseudomonas gessardii]ONH46306.1 relaxase [Pseudomonas gessardii]